MKCNLMMLAGTACLMVSPLVVWAGGEHAPEVQHEIHKQVVVAMSTDDFTLVETDISSLEPGDSETIVTDSGKTVDILKTLEGVEIYVDGELIDTGLEDMDHNLHTAPQAHHVVKHVEVICEDDEDCDKMVMVAPHADIDMETLHEWHDSADGEERVIVIKKKKYVEEY